MRICGVGVKSTFLLLIGMLVVNALLAVLLTHPEHKIARPNIINTRVNFLEIGDLIQLTAFQNVIKHVNSCTSI
jgi:hypothetical protein